MLITRTSQLSGETHTLDINVTQEQLDRFENRFNTGEYLQDIFKDISAGEREFIKTGITPKEWDEAFGFMDFESDEPDSIYNAAMQEHSSNLKNADPVNLQDDPGDSQPLTEEQWPFRKPF